MEKIEIRSEKVRKIIGRMPPYLVRYGLYIIIVILIILGSMAYYIPLDYPINIKATLWNERGKIVGTVAIPVNKDSFIDKTQALTLDFYSFKNMKGVPIYAQIFPHQTPKIILEGDGYILYRIYVYDPFIIPDTLHVKGQVKTSDLTFWKRIIK